MKETMKVTEAIAQLKIQDDRIDKALSDLKVVTANRISAQKVDGMTADEFKKLATSSYTSATTLINRYNAMKEAINEFNASTKVNIGGREMSVASALYMKTWGINQKKRLLDNLTKQLTVAETKMQRENGEKLDDAAERHAKQSFEGDMKTDKIKYLEFIEEYKSRNQFTIVDPLNIRKLIEELIDEIVKFETSVDTAIQIANATHDITIEY